MILPARLPGGGHFLYLDWSQAIEKRALLVRSVDGGEPVRLVQSDSMGVYADPGFLMFVRGTTLYAQKSDGRTLKVSGEPVRVADNVLVNAGNGRASFRCPVTAC